MFSIDSLFNIFDSALGVDIIELLILVSFLFEYDSFSEEDVYPYISSLLLIKVLSFKYFEDIVSNTLLFNVLYD